MKSLGVSTLQTAKTRLWVKAKNMKANEYPEMKENQISEILASNKQVLACSVIFCFGLHRRLFVSRDAPCFFHSRSPKKQIRVSAERVERECGRSAAGLCWRWALRCTAMCERLTLRLSASFPLLALARSSLLPASSRTMSFSLIARRVAVRSSVRAFTTSAPRMDFGWSDDAASQQRQRQQRHASRADHSEATNHPPRERIISIIQRSQRSAGECGRGDTTKERERRNGAPRQSSVGRSAGQTNPSDSAPRAPSDCSALRHLSDRR